MKFNLKLGGLAGTLLIGAGMRELHGMDAAMITVGAILLIGHVFESMLGYLEGKKR